MPTENFPKLIKNEWKISQNEGEILSTSVMREVQIIGIQNNESYMTSTALTAH